MTTRQELLEAGFTTYVDFPGSACIGRFLVRNRRTATHGYAGSPAWALVPYVMEMLNGPDARSWMINDYGYARAYRSPDRQFIAMVYFEKDDSVKFSFVLPTVHDILLMASSLAKYAKWITPVLDVPRDMAEVVLRTNDQIKAQFLVRDYLYNTGGLVELYEKYLAPATLATDQGIEWYGKTRKRYFKTLRSYTKVPYEICSLNSVHVGSLGHSEILRVVRAMIAKWRAPRVANGERMIFGDEYEYMFTSEMFSRLTSQGVPWSAHVLWRQGEALAATFSTATSDMDWACLVRISDESAPHAAEALWLHDAKVMQGRRYAADGCGSELSDTYGLSELKMRYHSWVGGDVRDMYVLTTTPEQELIHKDFNTWRDEHDDVMRSKGFSVPEHPPIL